jgi:hypothetical protein
MAPYADWQFIRQPVRHRPARSSQHSRSAPPALWTYLLLGLQGIILIFTGAIFLFAPPGGPSSSLLQTHFFGGFSIDSPERAADAAMAGVQEAIMYGSPVGVQSRLGQVFASFHLHEADGYLWELLYHYECHRELRLKRVRSDRYCHQDYPLMQNETSFLSAVRKHLREAADNRLINAYWVLDDWPAWDAGSANSLLQALHTLIHLYTPDRPTICGFGGEIGLHQQDTWNARLFLNFSPQACDMVALYIYSAPVVTSQPHPPSDAFDWPMTGILPHMFATLRKRGWNPRQEPLIGIVQAWAGIRKDVPGFSEVAPTAANMAMQSLSFCKAGAQSIIYYAWHDSTTTETPFTNAQMRQGVKLGTQACKAYWHLAR